LKKHIKILILSIAFLLVFPYQAFAYKVVVDAGHGGKDPGAIGVNGLQEKNVNLDIALKLRNELVKQGQEVMMTREDDRFLSLAERVNFADAQNADLFVSIHANSFHSSERGTMVLYYDDAYPQADYPASDRMKALTPYSKQLAKGVLDSFIVQAGTVNRGLVPSAVYVARMGSIPSILVETAFLSSAADAAMLASDEKRKQMAVGIANGILAFQPPVFIDTVGNWARDSILRMKDKGWIEGLDNRYEPERALTRAEFLTIMDRMFTFSSLKDLCSAGTAAATSSVYGCTPGTGGKMNGNYRDLPASHWSSAVFAKAQKLNLLQGYADGTIRPDQSITRAEVAVLFDRLLYTSKLRADPQATAYTLRFTDVPLQLWSANAIYVLAAKGIINGVTEDRFMPDRYITRSEMAAIMDRYAVQL
jgi:N-acetylmuramoyl-L-alanine amidase